MVKVVTLFLIAMAILAMFGRLRWPNGRPGPKTVSRCKSCGRPLVGKGGCDCTKGAT